MAEVRVVDKTGLEELTPRTFRTGNAAAVQVLLRGPFRLVRTDGDEEVPSELRLTIVDAEGTTLELFGPAEEIRTLQVDRLNFDPRSPETLIGQDIADFYGMDPDERRF